MIEDLLIIRENVKLWGTGVRGVLHEVRNPSRGHLKPFSPSTHPKTCVTPFRPLLHPYQRLFAKQHQSEPPGRVLKLAKTMFFLKSIQLLGDYHIDEKREDHMELRTGVQRTNITYKSDIVMPKRHLNPIHLSWNWVGEKLRSLNKNQTAKQFCLPRCGLFTCGREPVSCDELPAYYGYRVLRQDLFIIHF